MNILRGRKVSAWFVAPWRVVPAQPVLYLFIWIAGLHVIATPNNTQIGFSEAGLDERVYHWWNALILASPVMVAAAYVLIFHTHGHLRIAGLWVRLGGDVGVVSALAALIWTRILILAPEPNQIGDGLLFSLIALTGVTVFVAMLVVRDVGAIILLERLSRRLHSWDKGGDN